MNKMSVSELALKEAYLNGLLHMASCCSDWIGRSEITAECFSVDSFYSDFSSEYGINKDELNLIKEPITFRQELARWIGGKASELNDSVYWLFHHKLGDAFQVYRLKDEDDLISGFGWGEGGKGPYYFVEDLFFVQFKDVFVCLFLGNNE